MLIFFLQQLTAAASDAHCLTLHIRPPAITICTIHTDQYRSSPEHRGEDLARGERLDAVAVEPQVLQLPERPECGAVDGLEAAAAEVEADEVGRVVEGGGGQVGDGVGAQREAHQVAAVGRREPRHRPQRVGGQVQLDQVRQAPASSATLSFSSPDA